MGYLLDFVRGLSDGYQLLCLAAPAFALVFLVVFALTRAATFLYGRVSRGRGSGGRFSAAAFSLLFASTFWGVFATFAYFNILGIYLRGQTKFATLGDAAFGYFLAQLVLSPVNAVPGILLCIVYLCFFRWINPRIVYAYLCVATLLEAGWFAFLITHPIRS